MPRVEEGESNGGGDTDSATVESTTVHSATLSINGTDLGTSVVDVAAVGIGGVVCMLQSHTSTQVVASCPFNGPADAEKLIHGRPWLTTVSGGHGTGGETLSASSDALVRANGTDVPAYQRMASGYRPQLSELLASGGGKTVLKEVSIALVMVEGTIAAFRSSLFSTKEMPAASGMFARTAGQLQKLRDMSPMSNRLAVAVEQFGALSNVVGAGTDGLDQACEWARGITHKSSDGVLRLTELDWIRDLARTMQLTVNELDAALRVTVGSLGHSTDLQNGLSTHFNAMHASFKTLPLANLILASDELALITDDNFEEIRETLGLLMDWMRDLLPRWQTLDTAMKDQTTRVAAVINTITSVFNVLADKPSPGVERIMLVTELRRRSVELRKFANELPPNVIGAAEVVRVVDELMERLPSVFRSLEYAKDAINTAGAKVQGVTQGAVDDFSSIHTRREPLTTASADLQEKSETDVKKLLRATRGVSQALLYAIEDNVIGSEASVREELLDGDKSGTSLQDMIDITALVNKTLHDVVSLADSQRPILDMLQSTSEISTVCEWNTSTEVKAPKGGGLLSSVGGVYSMLEDVTEEVNDMSQLAGLQQCVADASCSTSVIVKLMKLRVRLKEVRTTLLTLDSFDRGTAAFAEDIAKKLAFVESPPEDLLAWERPHHYVAASPRAQFGIAANWAFIMPTNGKGAGAIVADPDPMNVTLARGNCIDKAIREGVETAEDLEALCGKTLRSNMHGHLFGAQEASGLAKEARVALRFEHSASPGKRSLNSTFHTLNSTQFHIPHSHPLDHLYLPQTAPLQQLTCVCLLLVRYTCARSHAAHVDAGHLPRRAARPRGPCHAPRCSDGSAGQRFTASPRTPRGGHAARGQCCHLRRPRDRDPYHSWQTVGVRAQ